jgi:hypothetical protein
MMRRVGNAQYGRNDIGMPRASRKAMRANIAQG